MDRTIVTTTVNVYKDQLTMFRSLDENLSEFVREEIDKKYESPEKIDQEIKELNSRLENLKSKKEKIESHVKENVPKEREFFAPMKQMVQKNPTILDGQRKRYKNIFGKNISREDFKKKCEQYHDPNAKLPVERQ